MKFTPKELRREMRRSFPVFCKAAYPDYETSPHLRRLQSALMLLEANKLNRLIISMPPRHGKSLTTSQLFPAWYLGRNPNKSIMITSYSGGLATSFKRRSLAFMKGSAFHQTFGTAAGGTVRLDKRTPQQVNLVGYEGGILTAGVGGSITGFGADLLIVDDPVKDAREAMSDRMRANTWDWFTSTAYTRLMPDAQVCIIMTRWHEDDLVGRLLEQLAGGDEYAEDWNVLHLPAMNSDGEALWPSRYSADTLRRISRTVGLRVWESLYQGNPSPPEGSLVHRSYFIPVGAVPVGADVVRVRYWDFAATEKGGDFTVGLLMSMTGEGQFTIEDVVRGQWGPAARNVIMRQVTEADQLMYGQVYTYFEREGGASGADMATAVMQMLAGFPVFQDRPRTNKVLRFDPFRSQAQVGNVRMLVGRWNKTYLDELVAFPFGKHDDQVDTTSGAFNSLTQNFSNFRAFLKDRYGFASPQAASEGYSSVVGTQKRRMMTPAEKEILAETGFEAPEIVKDRSATNAWDYTILSVPNPDLLNDIIYRRFGLYLLRDEAGEFVRMDDCLIVRAKVHRDELQTQLVKVGINILNVLDKPYEELLAEGDTDETENES